MPGRRQTPRLPRTVRLRRIGFGSLRGLHVGEALGSAPDARAYFFLSCQEKVAKKKSRPLRRPAAPGSLRCSAATGGCGTRGCAPQTVLAPSSVASCAARRRRGLIENRSSNNRLAHQIPFGVLFLPPRAAPSNGGRPGAVGEHCLRGIAPSLCLPPGHPSRAGQPAKPAA